MKAIFSFLVALLIYASSEAQIPQTLSYQGLLTDPSPSFVSLSANIFTLTAGEYFIEGSSPFYYTGASKIRLYNVSSSTVLADGTSEDQATQVQTRSEIMTRFTLPSSTQIRMEYFVQLASASASSLGTATSQGQETYTQIKITKLR